MKYKKITYPDLNNGDGCRVTLWLTGCNHHCVGCHNSELWDPNVGKEVTVSTLKTLVDILKLPYIHGLTLSGGDPLFWPTEDVVWVLEYIRMYAPKNKTIWLYTGNTYADINKHILELVDVVVDGEYQEDKRDLTLWFRGSSNQGIYRKYFGV